MYNGRYWIYRIIFFEMVKNNIGEKRKLNVIIEDLFFFFVFCGRLNF